MRLQRRQLLRTLSFAPGSNLIAYGRAEEAVAQTAPPPAHLPAVPAEGRVPQP